MPRSQIIYEKPWQPAFREFFDLVGEGWTAPEAVRVTSNPKRTRMTVAAVFLNATGHPMKLTARLRQYADGSWVQLEERLEARFEMRVSVGVE